MQSSVFTRITSISLNPDSFAAEMTRWHERQEEPGNPGVRASLSPGCRVKPASAHSWVTR